MLEQKYEGIEEVVRNIQGEEFNGFQHPETPVVTSVEPERLQLMHWGLIPRWARDTSIQDSTLNAKIETLTEKPSFKAYTENRCLIYADGFYEWQWLDPKGKHKQKYFIRLEDEHPFCFAGLWNRWKDPSTGLSRSTYTIITTEANELLSRIHNSKQRMPIVINPNNEQDWLSQGNIRMMNDFLMGQPC
ncbi:MAG: SOS response-associated peptidase [Bacteroidales bacterium]|nr:SOS response-associated peptidase [Bacteroidales bacterium]